MNRNAQIRRLLRAAPSTVDEIAALLAITPRSAHVGVWVLQRLGHVQKTGRAIPGGGTRPRNLYELTLAGRRIVREKPEAHSKRDWRLDRAQYLIECGRLDDLVREGLEHLRG